MSIRIEYGIEVAVEDSFGALRLIPKVVGQPIDPLLRTDIFSYCRPCFDAQPHAGYIRLMYVFPDSLGHLVCKSGIHEPIALLPGELLWSAAGRGIQTADDPIVSAGICSGAQFYIKLPPTEEVASPRHKVVPSADVVDIENPDARISLLFGQYSGHHVGIFGLPYALLEAQITTCATLPIPEGWSVMLFFVEGKGSLNGQHWNEDQFASLVSEQQLELNVDAPSRILIFMGQPNQTPLYWEGPFAMSSKERLEMVRNAYKLGFITPIKDAD